MPPLDAAYRNVTTGGFKGSHSTHNPPSVAAQAACEKCHSGSGSYTTAHMNDFVNMTSNINDSPHPSRGMYNKPRFFNQTSNPVMQTCSNVNCHFETTTPVWSSAPYSSPADCNRCHGAPPSDGSHPATSGSGKKHGDYYTTTTTSCSRCHPEHAGEATPFAHATSAGRQLIVTFLTAPNDGFGRYTGNVNYPNYLPSQSPPRNGTCRNLYCHSPGNKSSLFDAPNSSAVWGGTLDCKGCHKADLASGSYIATGSHGGHVNKYGMQYNIIKCYKCHATTTSAGMTVVDLPRHVNGQVEIAFSNTSSAAAGYYKGTLATPTSPMTKSPGSTYGQCTTVYCHSTGQGAGGSWPPTYSAPTWGNQGSGDCGTCHGNQFSHAGFGSTTPITSGSHTKHLSYTLNVNYRNYERCVACHAYKRDGFDSNNCNGGMCHAPAFSKHANYEINVNMPLYFGTDATYNGSSTPGTGYSSCSNVYCHSDGKATPTTYATPTWGNAASGACGTCHGTTADTPPASTPHAKHLGSANPYRFACATCHRGRVQTTANSTVAPAYANLTTHVNKVREVTFDSINPFGTYSSSTLSCRNLYCHSTGNTSVASGDLPAVYGGKGYARVTWSGTVSCTSCHGRSTATGMPDYNGGAPGSATANSHAKHVTLGAISCAECHNRTTKDGTTIRGDIPSSHVNHVINDVFFNLSGNYSAGTYTPATKTCNTILCHSNGRGTYQPTPPRWGETDTCDFCHPIASLGGAHNKHVDLSQTPIFYSYTANRTTSGGYNFGCSNCHPLVSTTNHAKGTIVLDFRSVAGTGLIRAKNSVTITASGPAGTPNSGTIGTSGTSVRCLNIYCHSNGYASNMVYATTPDWYGGSFAGDRCANCHGNSPNSTIAGSPAHYGSNFFGAGSPGGHIVGIHYDNIYTGTTGLATAGTLTTSSHGNATTSSSINCDTCHYGTVTSTSNDRNAVCASCHNGTTATMRGDMALTGKTLHVNGKPDVQFNTIAVRSKAQLRPYAEYTSVSTRNSGYKASGAYDMAKSALDTSTMWNSGTKTCSNVSCHFNRPISWTSTGTAYKCIICHD